MINNIKYQGHQNVEKDGNKIRIQVPSNIILQNQGALIPVIITHPQAVAQRLAKENKQIQALQTNALIDTGALGSVITPRIAQHLSLIQTGFQMVTSVNNEQQQPAYFARLQFPWGSGKDVQVICCPLKGPFECLIGRDIMMHWHFTYNGKDGSITICD
jgi:hypothetical protein